MALDHDTREQLVATVRRFVNDICRPNEQRVADTNAIPEPILDEMRRLGLFGLSIPEAYGGLGLTMEEEALVILEMGRTSPAFRSAFGTNVGIGSQGIVMFGSERQKQEWLPQLASGEAIASFALTEPDAGSDAGSLKTRAIRDADHYILNGAKRYITNANYADLLVVMARTDPTKPGADGISAFLVEKGTPGLKVGPVDRKMGQTGAPTAQVFLDNCRVPGSALLGGVEGQGFKNAMGGINTARLHVASTCVGQAERLTREALAYAMGRRQFGKSIVEHQSVANMLADCRTETFAARAMVLDVARRFSHPPSLDIAADIACAKYFGSEMVCRVADRAVQVLGGQGYLESHPIARLYRDVRLFRLFEGTSQIQQMVIARAMVRQAGGGAKEGRA